MTINTEQQQAANENNLSETVVIDTAGIYYRDLNARLREEVSRGIRNIRLDNVCGQRYIGTDLNAKMNIDIYGTPGNDLGMFMKGPSITVHGNAQDGCGNTMDEGRIVIHGHAGDTAGLAARGGTIMVRDGVGYRAGIHMKEYKGKLPVIVIGGTAQDFCGEYMAGGVLILLGLDMENGKKHGARYIGTGMHGGVIYLRGEVEDYQLGKEVGIAIPDEKDYDVLRKYVDEYVSCFGGDPEEIMAGKFLKLYPMSLRPYGRLYAY